MRRRRGNSRLIGEIHHVCSPRIESARTASRPYAFTRFKRGCRPRNPPFGGRSSLVSGLRGRPERGGTGTISSWRRRRTGASSRAAASGGASSTRPRRSAGRALQHDLGPRERAALHARGRRDRPRPRPRLPRRLPVHPRRLSVDVPRQALDDAAVRRLRHRRGDEPALPLPARARADRPLDGLRHADADGLRLGSRALARRGRARGRRDRLARRHRDALPGHPARRGLDLDDDQRPGRDAARVLHLRRRAAGSPARGAPRERSRRTSSRSTSPRRNGSSRPSRPCGS